MSELKKAIVTGATSGIGQSTVQALTDSGRQVLAVGRRADRLQALADKTGASILAADVRDQEALESAIEEFGPDILVNNAGVGHGIDGLEDMDPAHIQEAIDINVTAPVQITAAALKGMRTKGYGHVVNIGSIAGLHTLVSALYGGTKAAIHLFSQNLRFELAGSGIRVTEICPGRVASGFYTAAKGDREKLDKMKDSGIRELQPEDIAASILFAIDAPSHVNVAMIEVLPTDQAIGGVKLHSPGE
ncbi:MAG: SDR family oxidoreductase [Pseudomonadota bacterium]